MAAPGGVAPAGEGLRYAEYAPHSAKRPDADIGQQGLSYRCPSAGKAKIRTAHRRIMILNHPDKESLDPQALVSLAVSRLIWGKDDYDRNLGLFLLTELNLVCVSFAQEESLIRTEQLS
ncbi:PREDICTED: dnaJ homolog subfamily C member 15 [Propithecus coquereli]|uniref:dnaJ homolog subfamily C member 15 n=1 Tax=Propithecus coquereli TaxID=379532 RepID=UPI00063F266E|nr:PREDICTED: dnaJ homolog subfamily C member 15 [Propithecus coquereli]